MASDEQGNKGIKRKLEKSAEESANKQLYLGPSTSSGIKQGQGNVRKINWMKYCNTKDLGADPQCTICNEYHPLYIESSPFEDHYKKHLHIDTKGNDSEWIFRYFDFVKNAQHLKCKNCEETVEVLKFKGPFVKHFNDEAHQEIAKRRTQVVVTKDAEKVKRRFTIDFLFYLRRKFESKYTEKGQLNLRKIVCEMKCCNTNDTKADPQCTICNEYHPFYIESSRFKDHYKDKHPGIDTKGNESEWIFHYFDTVRNTQYLKCKKCDENIEVRGFGGPLVEHFNDEAHQVIAERRFQGGNEDAEIAERLRLTKNFIKYLATVFNEKDAIKDACDARIIAWWMEHVGKVERNTVHCNVSGCQDKHSFPVYLNDPAIRTHVQSHYQEEKYMNNWEYLLFDDYLLRCKLCKKVFSFILTYRGFRRHLQHEHNITAPRRGDQSRQGINNNDGINERINNLMLYLIKNYKPYKMGEANKPT